MRRAVLALALVLMALVSAPRLHLDYLPRIDEPELTVSLHLDGMFTDPAAMTHRWIVPIESAIRALGDVTALRTQLSSDGASVQVRLRPEADVDVKAARLQSDLARVRSRLPQGSTLSVWPSSQSSDQPSLVVALTGERSAERAETVAEIVRTARGVRDVRIFGAARPTVDIELRSGAPSLEEGALRRALAPALLGTTSVGGRRQWVVAAPAADGLERVPVRSGDALVPLEAVADLARRDGDAWTRARVDGQPSTLLLVFRDDEVSLFAFERSVAERLRRSDAPHEIVWSDGRELRGMLWRAAIAAAVGSLLLAVGGWVVAGFRGMLVALYVPLAFAAFVNLARLASMRIDASTVVAAAVAFAAIAPFAAWRFVTARSRGLLAVPILFSLAIPVAVMLTGGSIQSLLHEPALAFVAAVAAGAIAAALLPGGNDRVRIPGGRLTRLALRHAASLVLATAAFTTLLLSYLGNRLDPRVETAAEPSRLSIQLNLPAGTTIADTLIALERIEDPLRKAREIERFWSFVRPAVATTVVELKPRFRSGAEGRLFRSRLRDSIPFAPGIVQMSGSLAAGGAESRGDLEERPFTDEAATVYRFLIKGTDLEEIRRTFDQLGTRLARQQFSRGLLTPEWPPDTPVIELATRPGIAPEAATAAAAALARRTMPPRRWTLPGGGAARIIPHGGVPSDQATIQRADLFSSLYDGTALSELFEARTALLTGGATRELGRFVLPVTARIPGPFIQLEAVRANLDRAIAGMPLPPGVTIERPSLSKWRFSKAKVRTFVLASLLPALLLAIAAIVLSSVPWAAASVAVILPGVSLVPLLFFALAADVDERTLFGIAGAASACTAVAVAALVRAGRSTRTIYRAVRRMALPAALAAAAGSVMLAVLALDARGARDGWREPLLAAAAVVLVSTVAAVFAAPALVLLWRELRRGRSPAARAEARPVAWGEAGKPRLVIRNVTKRYRTGLRALTQVSAELGPGVVGLLGPNGAGKTTLLRILTGLLQPSRGQIVFRGVPVSERNLAAYRELIGFLPQEFNAYAGITAAAFLDYWALERGIDDAAARREEIARLLVAVGLEKDGGRRVRDFSGGMRQRIGIARSLLGAPPLLSSTSRRPASTSSRGSASARLMKSLARGRIVILSTHIASDVEATATRILLLSRGRLLWDGTPEALIRLAAGRVFQTVVSEADARSLSRRYWVTYRVRVAHGVRVRGVATPGEALPGPAVEATLEEAYLASMPGERAAHGGAFHFLYEQGG